MVRTDGDDDQLSLYHILLDITREERIYLPLACNQGTLPTVEAVFALREQIEKMQEWLSAGEYISDQLSTLRQLINANPQAVQQWMLVANQVSRLICNGMETNSVLLREILLPDFESIPASDDYDEHFTLTLREIDKYLASRSELDDTLDLEQPTAEVSQVRQLLGGRKVVLIGGHQRNAAKHKLKEAFGLDEMVWVPTKPHESVHGFESTVHKPGVKVVLLAIRFSSHAFGDVKLFCDVAGVPLVRLPAGYGRNQVAHHILEQCGERLTQMRNSA